MSLKAALAGLPCGGGKAVICAPPDIDIPGFNREGLLSAFGRFVDGLGGRYLTCEDSGSSAADMDIVRRATRHVLGTSIEQGGSGDPSPFTALGVRRGIEAVAQVVLGRPDLRGLHVLVQGVGHVGANLARELARCGARLTITDVDAGRRAKVAAETGAAQVEPEAIFDVVCDVLSPCAMGGVISRTSVGRLRCKAVAGAANNQLETPSVGRTLHERGIFYAPDYAINAGGLINVAQELVGYDAEAVRGKVTRIYDTIAEIAERSQRLDRPPSEIADELATELMSVTEPARRARC
jgi:leucine dehydrogenase